MSISGKMNDVYCVLKKDPIMDGLIQEFGEQTLSVSSDFFDDIISSIIGQLLSYKAADAIYKRVSALCTGEAFSSRVIYSGSEVADNKIGITPQGVLSVSDEMLRGAGCSYAKIYSMKAVATKVLNGEIDLNSIANLENEQIISLLSSVKGIGRWTAEMFLIFSLAKEDIFSFLDGGLNSAVNRLYGNGGNLTKKEVSAITEAWSPYRSYASLYLWKSLQNK